MQSPWIATALDWTIPKSLSSAGVITDQETLVNSELARQAAIIVDRLSTTGQKLALDQLRDLEKRLPKNFGEKHQYEGSLDDLLQLDMFKAIAMLKAHWNISGEEVAERMAKLAQIWPEVWDAESQKEA